ncbi:toll/interleukin-1 receptor domain-containing protein [Methylosinus sporium]|uniref:Toll/interleukin-1 receptor domain-containing protein n=1 Tax=Methylosinus sporium TaxID=428 RepID=A0A549SCB1_METSR|nr:MULTISPECIES: toll/interleukin-1 receptor domain-containing protein [Methylosinus]MBU3891055.1 toll/interleukin-1 receptor domain-containing protein [Methylosinus sp. KRF6]TRL20380.1 toll/interleukin-1 receptor domain-containing protein [Methylosinus sporium]
MARLFLSYSHADEALRSRLETHLAMLKRDGHIETWNDRRLNAGDEFDRGIRAELERADVILLLISPDFLASNYCFDVEVMRAMERHEAGEARVIPVILRHCDWLNAPFGKLLAAPKDGKPVQSWPDLDEAFLDVVRKIRDALPATGHSREPVLRAAVDSQRISEPGPRSSNLRIRQSFTDADRDVFLHDGFDYMARFFEASLEELQARHASIRTTFRRLDANRFTAVVYRAGAAVARCKIALGGMFGSGVTFSYSDQAADNSCNESLSVEADDQGLYFKAMGMASMGRGADRHLTFEGAAEYYWGLLIEPLQRVR